MFSYLSQKKCLSCHAILLITLAMLTTIACQDEQPLTEDTSSSSSSRLPGGKYDSADGSIGKAGSNYYRREAGTRLHSKNLTVNPSSLSSTSIDTSSVMDAIKKDFKETFLNLPAHEVQLLHSTQENNLTHITLRQTIDGVPIVNTRIHTTLRTSAEHSSPVYTSYDVYQSPSVNTEPTLSINKAIELSREFARTGAISEPTSATLSIYEHDRTLYLTYAIQFPNMVGTLYVIANGPHEGRTFTEESLINISGKVTARISDNGYDTSGDNTRIVPLDGVTVSQHSDTYTQPDGTFTNNATSGDSLHISLSGPIANVQHWAGSPPSSFHLGGTPVSLSDNPSDLEDIVYTHTVQANHADIVIDPEDQEYYMAANNAYHHIVQARRYLEDNGFDADTFESPVHVQVNRIGGCFSAYSPTQKTLYFSRSGDLWNPHGISAGIFGDVSLGAIAQPHCNNTARPSIIIHEYTHFVDDLFGGISSQSLSEGWSDALSCLILDDPVIGSGHYYKSEADLYKNYPIHVPGPFKIEHYGHVRTCDNDYKLPQTSWGHDPHEVGQAWSGFVWHARQNLIARYGSVEGDRIARKLILPSLRSNAPDIKSALIEVFLRDDDDGDLGTPSRHYDELHDAAMRHNLHDAIEIDSTPPAAVSDLQVLGIQGVWPLLKWTAPGDDDHTGTVDYYTVVASTEPINESNFEFAHVLDAPTPREAGSAQYLEGSQLTHFSRHTGTIYFALVSHDNVSNVSTLSNVASGVLKGDVQSVFLIGGSDSASNGAALDYFPSTSILDWSMSGLWHATHEASYSGRKAIWYGDESKESFDGGPSEGSFISPVLSMKGLTHPYLTVEHFGDFETHCYADTTTLLVEAVDGSLTQVFQSEDLFPGFTSDWVHVGIDLGAFKGKDIQLTFHFNAGDDFANTGLGWILDDLRLVDIGDNPWGYQLVINEILPTPSLELDANMDGIVDPQDDEFIELVNSSIDPVDLSGAVIKDNDQVRFTFPSDYTLAPNEAVVIFGGGSPQITGAAFFTAESGLSLDDDGDRVVIQDREGRTIAHLEYTTNKPDISLSRETDGGHNAPMVFHDTLSTLPASPGTSPLEEPFAHMSTSQQIVINEIFARPWDHDTNGNGRLDEPTDRYIELYNRGNSRVDLSGARIENYLNTIGVFPQGTVIEPGAYLVVFGNQFESVDFNAVNVNSFTYSGDPGGLVLSGSGDDITITSPNDDLIASATYGLEADGRVAITRLIQGDPTSRFVRHDLLSDEPLSPGRKTR